MIKLKPLEWALLNKPTGQVDEMQPEEKPSKKVLNSPVLSKNDP